MFDLVWTPEGDADILHRYNVLKQSTKTIGDARGISKNAVCGRLQRLRKRGVLVDLHHERNFTLRRKPKEIEVEEPEVDSDLPPLRSPYAEAVAALTEQAATLTSRSCRFIEGDPLKGGRFCAEPTKPESSYCEKHHKRCWKKAEGPVIDISEIREARVIVRGV